jgi:hypothetical protein
VTSDKILIEGDIGGVYTFWMSYNSLDSTLSINPYNNFAPLESVTVWISSGIKDLAGNIMSNTYSWWFRTGAALDTIGPSVDSLSIDPDTISTTGATRLDAILSDNRSVSSAEYFIDAIGSPGTGNPTLPLPPDSFGLPTVSVFDTIFGAGLSAGRHSIYLHGHDPAGNWGAYDSVHLFITGLDTIGPVFTITFEPNPANIGDSVLITALPDEILHPDSAVVCTVWTADSIPHVVRLDTAAVGYEGYISTVGFINGDCQVVIYGYDCALNIGTAQTNLHVGPTGEFLPAEMVYAWASDVYLFRLSAESDVPGTKGSVLKKFAIVK